MKNILAALLALACMYPCIVHADDTKPATEPTDASADETKADDITCVQSATEVQSASLPVPPPWQIHFDEEHQCEVHFLACFPVLALLRCLPNLHSHYSTAQFFYNPETQQTSWDRLPEWD
mgnify:CR=1 FL=1